MRRETDVQTKNTQWVENNLTNIHIFMDICFSPHGTMLTALLWMCVYGCSPMLDGLVSSHRFVLAATAEKNNFVTFATVRPGG
jgi:hypothetical protein